MFLVFPFCCCVLYLVYQVLTHLGKMSKFVEPDKTELKSKTELASAKEPPHACAACSVRAEDEIWQNL